MRILPPPLSLNVAVAITDRATGHPDLVTRLADLESRMKAKKMPYLEIEFFRYSARQGWLYGSGRGKAQMHAKGISEAYARPDEPIVTNAWSAENSAHGWVRQVEDALWVPAAAAVDIVPVGPDDKPWTKDDPIAEFVAMVAECSAAVGLRHFRNAGGHVTDCDHIQLVEWRDDLHDLISDADYKARLAAIAEAAKPKVEAPKTTPVIPIKPAPPTPPLAAA